MDKSLIEKVVARLYADEALQLRLADCKDTAGLARELANLEGDVQAWAAHLDRLRDDPAASPPRLLTAAPPRGWLPTHFIDDGSGPQVGWAWFGPDAMEEPFYWQTATARLELPLNLLLRCATPVDALLAFDGAARPDLLIFHVSRCGSTLLGRMFGTIDGVDVVSEPGPFDVALRLHLAGLIPAQILRGMMGALCRDRGGGQQRHVVKLDAWHAPALPRIARLFPDTPMLFLHRDPHEVLVSQARAPGSHCVKGELPLELYGFVGGEAVAAEDYPAWVLARIYAAGAAAGGTPKLAYCDYADLPGAFAGKILPHAGITPSGDALTRVEEAARTHSKDGSRPFTDDRADKREAIDADMLRLAETSGLDASYASLRSLEGGERPAVAGFTRSAAPAIRTTVFFSPPG